MENNKKNQSNELGVSKLQQLLNERKLGPTAAGKLLGMSKQQVYRQASLVKIGVEAAIKYSRILEVDPAYFRPDIFYYGEFKPVDKYPPKK